MNARLAAIEAKRARLVERAAREREDVVQTFALWARPLAFADRCVAAVSYVVSRPPLVIAAVALFTLLRPQRGWRLLRRAWSMWQAYRWLAKKVAI